MTANMTWDNEAGFWIVTDEFGDIWDVIANGSATAGRAAAACEREGECRIFIGDGTESGGELSWPVIEGDAQTFTCDDSTEYKATRLGWEEIVTAE